MRIKNASETTHSVIRPLILCMYIYIHEINFFPLSKSFGFNSFQTTHSQMETIYLPHCVDSNSSRLRGLPCLTGLSVLDSGSVYYPLSGPLRLQSRQCDTPKVIHVIWDLRL